MTVQPVLPPPAPNAGATEAPASGVDAEFAALVEQNLGGQSNPAKLPGKGGDPTGVSLGGAPAGDPTASDGTADATDKDISSDDVGGDVASALMAALSGAVVSGAAAASPVGVDSSGTAAPASSNGGSTAAATGQVSSGAASPMGALASGAEANGQAATQNNLADPDAAQNSGALSTSGLVPVAPGSGTGTGGDATADQQASHAKGAAAESVLSAQHTTSAGSTADLGLSFAAPTQGPAHPAAPGTAAPATVHVPVADQVFGEASRLVSRGDGTHRITIKLQPEALGDVHVTLSVKNGEVHVDLAADRNAHHALIEGASELHRLLESVGAKTSDIVVKDLPSFNPNRSDLLGQPGGQHGAGGREQSPDQTAGKQSGETSARDGGTTGAAAGRQSSPIDPGTRTRSAGVDVTM